tara:strand:+ start:39 stop:260 length:222 start_codon:yes stop_codon:yes gene_type:complete
MTFFENKKLMFSFLAAAMYLVIASPVIYNTVGSVLGLDNYDDHTSNDRTVLLFVHGLVYFLGTLALVNFYRMP